MQEHPVARRGTAHGVLLASPSSAGSAGRCGVPGDDGGWGSVVVKGQGEPEPAGSAVVGDMVAGFEMAVKRLARE